MYDGIIQPPLQHETLHDHRALAGVPQGPFSTRSIIGSVDTEPLHCTTDVTLNNPYTVDHHQTGLPYSTSNPRGARRPVTGQNTGRDGMACRLASLTGSAK